MNVLNLNLGLGFQKDKGDAKKAIVETKQNGGHPEADVVPLGGAASRRRLRHVAQFALRGLDLESAALREALGDGFVLEVAEESADEALERSDVLRTMNPTWTPVCGIPGGRQLACFELRIVGMRQANVLWRSTVRLSELEPLCRDLEELRALPPFGSPLLRLGDRGQWFTLPGTRGASPAAPPTEVRRGNRATKQIQASEVCEKGERIAVMLDRLRTLQAQSLALRRSMENCFEKSSELQRRREHRLLYEERVGQLRRKASQRREEIAKLRARLEKSRSSSEADRLSRCAQRLKEAEEEQRKSVSGLVAVYSGLRALWRQLRCRQMRMLHEVSQVYPIESCVEKCGQRYWTIRRLIIAGIDKLSRQDLREEEDVSSALGYLAHLLTTLAGILEVPLRITVHGAGCSRSCVSDPHESSDLGAPPLEWPLYYREVEKPRFERALRLLRDGLHQFLYSRGYFDERLLSNGQGNLLECAELIVRQEMGDPT